MTFNSSVFIESVLFLLDKPDIIIDEIKLENYEKQSTNGFDRIVFSVIFQNKTTIIAKKDDDDDCDRPNTAL